MSMVKITKGGDYNAGNVLEVRVEDDQVAVFLVNGKIRYYKFESEVDA